MSSLPRLKTQADNIDKDLFRQIKRHLPSQHGLLGLRRPLDLEITNASNILSSRRRHHLRNRECHTGWGRFSNFLELRCLGATCSKHSSALATRRKACQGLLPMHVYATGPIGLLTAITTVIRFRSSHKMKRLIGRQFKSTGEVLEDVTSVSFGEGTGPSWL